MQAMESSPLSNKLATTSLTLAIVAWILYIGQWCFDFTIGLLLAIGTGGTSAICSSVLDFLPFVLWLAAIISGHISLGQIKRTKARGKSTAIGGLVLSYFGLFFIAILVTLMIILIITGVGTGWLERFLHPGLTNLTLKLFPSFWNCANRIFVV
jgi:hypothetical protein